MLTILSVVLPVFLLIGAGYVAARTRAFPDAGIDGLIAFVTRIATPSLLFIAMYRLDVGAVFEWRMLISFYLGAFACFFVAAGLARWFGRRPGEAVVIGFSAFFSNTILVGLPIATRAYGDEVTQNMFGVIAFHASVLLSFGMVAMEMTRRDGLGPLAGARRAARSILSNALMLGILSGLALNLLAVPLPAPMADAFDMLASATLPTALFALGAVLTRYRLQDEIGVAVVTSACALVLHPAIVWAMTTQLFALPDAFVRAAVLTAAMPSGINAYVFAAMYRRAEGIAASAVLLSTALGVFTISVWLAILGGAG
ncbi:MAG: AEC family transporter [Pseudomonadota bacterium]